MLAQAVCHTGANELVEEATVCMAMCANCSDDACVYLSAARILFGTYLVW